MNSIFLPKEINKSDGSPVCYDVQSGIMKTDIHWHSCAEIIHMVKGSALIFSNEKWEMLNEGDTVFLPPGHLHCCHCTDERTKRTVIGMEEGAIPYLGNDHDAALNPFHSENVKNMLIFKSSENFIKLFAFFEKKNDDRGVSSKLDALIKIQQIYCEMLKIWESAGTVHINSKKSPIVLGLENIMKTRFSESLDAVKVARELNISYSYMANVLHRELNSNFGDLLLKERIEASKKLLLTTEMSITDIALETGFTDSSYFIKKFRIYTGTTPHNYRVTNLRIIK